MKLHRLYDRTVFGTEVLEEAHGVMGDLIPDDEWVMGYTLSVTSGRDTWTFDTKDEFYAAHRGRDWDSFDYEITSSGVGMPYRVWMIGGPDYTKVDITAPDRAGVLRISAVFERKEEQYSLPPVAVPPPPPEPAPRVFIGHGRSPQWRDLKDHLHDLHDYEVEAYETGARTGLTIKDILATMLTRSSFAVLVMTAEDEMQDGTYQARPNVIHETGLFQGALGFARAIVLLAGVS